MGDRTTLSITRGISYGFAALILLYVADGVFSLRAMQTVSGLTRTIHNHPLVVSNASQQATTDIVKIYSTIKELVFFSDVSEMESTLREVERLRIDTSNQL